MCFQYNIVNCKVAIIWFILCQRLRPASGTARGRERATVSETSLCVCVCVCVRRGLCCRTEAVGAFV